MPQDRLTELKLHGIGLMKKVHKTKIFRNLEEKQALQLQDNAKKPQQSRIMPKNPNNSAGPALSYGSCSEKRLRSDGSASVLSVTCKKTNTLTIFVSIHNIFKNTYSARNQGSLQKQKQRWSLKKKWSMPNISLCCMWITARF